LSTTESKKLVSTTKDSGPWFSFFTKGDKEYHEYMTTEWGFEKVRTTFN
jgi:hypothetical protein